MQPTAKIMPLYVAKHCFTLLQRNNRLCRHRAALLFNVSIAVLLRVPSASNSNRDKSHEFHRTLFPRTITRGTIARCIMPITCVTQHETKWFPLRVKAKTWSIFARYRTVEPFFRSLSLSLSLALDAAKSLTSSSFSCSAKLRVLPILKINAYDINIQFAKSRRF